MSYQQGQQTGPPYPQQGYIPPTGGAPYPTPTYPSVNPNAIGYNNNASTCMKPMPLPTYSPSYPPSSGGYPPCNSGYPPSSGGYPPSSCGYPPPSGGYPQSVGVYPPSSGGYPPSSCGYPPPSGGHLPTSGGFQPSSGELPPAVSAYPTSCARLPPTSGGYPPVSGGHHPTSGKPSDVEYPPSSGGHPPSNLLSNINSPATQIQGSNSPISDASSQAQEQYEQAPKILPRGVTFKHQGSSKLNTVTPKRTPTVVPANPFNPRADAEILRKAMKGFGTDEKAIINVLAHRTNAQRLQIAVEFKTLYGKDLVKDLKSECRGDFENLLVAMMTTLVEFYAKELHDAMEGLGTDEDVLIEIMCTKSNEEIKAIREAYYSMYQRSLEDDLIGDTGGTFKRLMVSLCNAGRDESMVTNLEEARTDAQSLLTAGELKWGTDESTFNAILCQRNYAQLQLIFQEYNKLTGHDIEKAIKSEFSGDAEQALLAVIRSIKNQPGFFAGLLNKSMKGLGTSDRDLIRLVVTRSEMDMVEIKKEYQAKYGESLADAIKGDCSGDYKKCLLHLIGEA